MAGRKEWSDGESRRARPETQTGEIGFDESRKSVAGPAGGWSKGESPSEITRRGKGEQWKAQAGSSPWSPRPEGGLKRGPGKPPGARRPGRQPLRSGSPQGRQAKGEDPGQTQAIAGRYANCGRVKAWRQEASRGRDATDDEARRHDLRCGMWTGRGAQASRSGRMPHWRVASQGL